MPIADFGLKSELSLPDDPTISRCGQPAGDPLDDPISAIRAALADPLRFPPLNRCVVAGDRVVIALGEGLNESDSLVAGAVLELIDADIKPEAITVLRSVADAKLTKQPPTRRLPPELADRVNVEVHDPHDRERLAMLNVSSDDQPIYLNRAIVDAELVLPIGTARPDDAWGYSGSSSSVYPVFADAETQQRFQQPRLAERKHRQQLEEAREAVWFLGSRLIVQVVPGAGNTLMHVVAGESDAVDSRSRDLSNALWRYKQPHRGNMVVATVAGGREQQSWTNFARALDAAMRVVSDDGTVAICCDLQTKPGKSLRRLVDAHSLETACQQIERDATPDASAAKRLAEALTRVNVYMLSRLDEDIVHSLGIGYIAAPDEVGRLVSRHDSCILVQDAHHAVPEIVGEVVE